MKIIKMRKAAGITQQQLAELCGTTQQQIARIENGAVDPRLSTLRRIADSLGCELRELFITRPEFLEAVRRVAERRGFDAKTSALLELNALCAIDEQIPSFHPYWEEIAVEGGRVVWKQKRGDGR